MSYRLSETDDGDGPGSANGGRELSVTERWGALMLDRRLARLRLNPAPGLRRIGTAASGWTIPCAVLRPGWAATVVGAGLAREISADLLEAGAASVSVLTDSEKDASGEGDGRVIWLPSSEPHCGHLDRGHPRSTGAIEEAQPATGCDLLLTSALAVDDSPPLPGPLADELRTIVVGVQLGRLAGARELARLVREFATAGYEVVARDPPRRLTFLKTEALQR